MSQKPNPSEAGRTFSQQRHLLFSWAARHWRSHILQLLILQLYWHSGGTDSSHSRATFRALAQVLRHRVHSGLQDDLVGTKLLQFLREPDHFLSTRIQLLAMTVHPSRQHVSVAVHGLAQLVKA